MINTDSASNNLVEAYKKLNDLTFAHTNIFELEVYNKNKDTDGLSTHDDSDTFKFLCKKYTLPKIKVNLKTAYLGAYLGLDKIELEKSFSLTFWGDNKFKILKFHNQWLSEVWNPTYNTIRNEIPWRDFIINIQTVLPSGKLVNTVKIYYRQCMFTNDLPVFLEGDWGSADPKDLTVTYNCKGIRIEFLPESSELLELNNV